MGINYNPSTITDSLILYYDSGNSKSYPGTGTSSTNLITNTASGTLTNGPVFSSSNGGIITFNGSSNFIEFSSSTSFNVGNTDFTIMSWIKTSNKSNFQTIVSLDDSFTGNGIVLYTNTTSGVLRTWVAGSVYNGGIDISDNTWKFVGIVRSSGVVTQYVNATANGSFSATGSVTSNQKLRIAGNTNYFNGSIPVVQFYNKALSQSEVLQNFSATRGRYGV